MMLTKKILLLKVPQCEYIDYKANNLANIRNFVPNISLALASLEAFINKYSNHFNIISKDVNTIAYINSKTIIDRSSFHTLIDAIIDETEYDALGISCSFANNYQWVKYAANYSKIKNSNIPVIIGGGYSTLYPELSIKVTNADYAVIGEGEATFLYLLNKIFDIDNDTFDQIFPQNNGYAYRDKSSNAITVIPKSSYIKNLDLLPFPDWDLEFINHFFDKFNKRELPIISSRGCNFKCIYCSTKKAWGNSVRLRSAKNILAEIDYLYKKYAISRLHFVDDNMTINKQRINDILNGMIDRKYNMTWDCANFAIKTLHKDTAKLMLKSNMDRVTLAIESGSQDIQKIIGKNLDLKTVQNVYQWFNADDSIPIHLNFMIGFPMETIQDIKKTINFAKHLRAHWTQINIVTVWPHTQLYDMALEKKQLTSEFLKLDNLDYRKSNSFKNVSWTYDDINQIAYDTNIILNFLEQRDLEHPKNYARI